MPENNQTNTEEIVRERANTSSKNTIVMLPDIIRAYHEIGLLSDAEKGELDNMTNDNMKIGFLQRKIRRLSPEHKLAFCDAFVGDDLTDFHGATPAILADAYRAVFQKAQQDDTQKERLQKIAERIDNLSADFASSSGMIIDEKVVDTTNIADVYEGFADMLHARMGDTDKIKGEDKDAKIAEINQKMADLGVALDETKIQTANNNFEVLDAAIGEYDDIWGLSKISSATASKMEDRWDKIDYHVSRAEIWDETKEVMSQYKFLDDKGNEIPQFKRNGRKVLKDSRMATIIELARHNVIKRHAGKFDEKINSDALEEELNDEVLFLLWNMKTQGQNVEASMDSPEIFMDYTKRDEILENQAAQGGEISDWAYGAMLTAHTNSTAGWLARIKGKAGAAAAKDDMHRFFDKASSVANLDARMKKRKDLFVRILKGFASAFIASALITTIATAAAATAGISLAAGLAITGFITALGMGLAQYHRWKKAQQAAGLPTDRKALLKDKRMLASMGTSAIAVIAMVFGAVGLAEAAMVLGYGALALGGTKNAVEMYRDAQNANMSVVESLAWAIAGAGAIAGGGFAGRAAAHGVIDWINHRWPENTTFQQEVHGTKEHTITGDIEHTKTYTNYPDGMIDRAEGAVRNWYAEQYPNNPEILQQHIDAVNQYNADHGTDIDPWVTLRAMSLCDGHSGYGAPGWINSHDYSAADISMGAHAINPDGTYNPDGMSILQDLQMNHMDAYGHIGRAGNFANDLYHDLGPTPHQSTISYSEPYRQTTEVPYTDYNSVDTNGVGMAAFGDFNPRERFQRLRERVGSFVDRIRRRGGEPVPEPTPIPKPLPPHEEQEQLLLGPGRADRVLPEPTPEPLPSHKEQLLLGAGRSDRLLQEPRRNDELWPDPKPEFRQDGMERVLWIEPSMARRWKNAKKQLESAKTKAEKTKLHQEINYIRNQLGHATDEEIDRGVEAAFVREELFQCRNELMVLRANKPDQKRGATKYDLEDWRRKQAVLVARFQELNRQLDNIDWYHAMPTQGVQAQKKEQRREQVKDEKPNSNSKYPISDKVQDIIKNMPTLGLKVNRDSLGNIQQSTPEHPYPPVKALCGVFTWSHDVAFAKEILELLPDMTQRGELLQESFDYYRENYNNDEKFFNDWVLPDLAALVADGVISQDVLNALRNYYNFGPVTNQQDYDTQSETEKLEDIDWSKYQSPFVFDHDKIEVERPYDLRDKFNLSDNMVRGFNIADMMKKTGQDEKQESVKPIAPKQNPKPKPKTLAESVESAYGKLISNKDENRHYFVPAALEELAQNDQLIEEPIGTYNGLPFSLVKINGNDNPFFESLDGPCVIIDWEGIRFPFVLSTGLNPKVSVPAGKWYPVSYVFSDGRLYNQKQRSFENMYKAEKLAIEEHLEKHEQIPDRLEPKSEYSMLMEIAEFLDKKIGDVRNWQDDELTRQYNEGGNVGFIGGCDCIPPVDVWAVVHELGKSEYFYNDRSHYVYTPGSETITSRETSISYRALKERMSEKWEKAGYNFWGRTIRRVGEYGREIFEKLKQKFNGTFQRGRGE